MMNTTSFATVSRPGRYLGQEYNAVVKAAETVELSCALIFPDLYEVGMSHQGLQILYHILNRRPDIVAEQIRRDAIVYLRSLADLFAVSSWHEARFDGPYALWQSSGRVPTLLQQALAQRMASTVENIFRLLKLIHPARDVEATYRSLGPKALQYAAGPSKGRIPTRLVSDLFSDPSSPLSRL